MRAYFYRHYFLFAFISMMLLFIALLLGRFPYGYSLFINAIIWGGLVGALLVHLYFRHLNLWILYFNLQIAKTPLFMLASFIFITIFSALTFLCGGSLGL